VQGHRELLQAAQPVISSGKVMWAGDKKHLSYRALALPVDGADAPLRHLLFVFEFYAGRPTAV
ncbi:MAG: hypothetical protein VW405_18330, partial [Rhodospirillaceae bacterium]